jgi:hypothetical protein
MKHPPLFVLFFFLVLQPFNAVVLQAQVDRTAITGTVTDQQGHPVLQSTIRATERSTGFRRETSTTSQGTYELPGIPPGIYTVQFSKAGFSNYMVDRVEQTVGQTRTLNAELGVAGAKDETSVLEPLVQLDTVSATVGAAIEQAQVNDLPINGRNWATLTALAPGGHR